MRAAGLLNSHHKGATEKNGAKNTDLGVIQERKNGTEKRCFNCQPEKKKERAKNNFEKKADGRRSGQKLGKRPSREAQTRRDEGKISRVN